MDKAKPERKKITLNQGKVTKLSAKTLKELEEKTDDEWFEEQNPKDQKGD